DTSLIVTTADNVTPLLITAGTSQDIELNVLNSGKTTLSDVIVTLSTSSDSLKIVGKPKWIIPVIEPGSSHKITSQVFAATSLIDTPVSFLVTEDYIVEGEKKTETINIGGYVAGNIMLKLYDTEVSQQGNQFNVVGNILNQGSTTGKFSSIELISFTPQITTRSDSDQPKSQESFEKPSESKELTSAPQYLGDLPDDSTIPFSITLPPNQIVPGVYPATFKIVYTDDLKKSHEVIIDSQVKFQPQQNNLANSRNQGSNLDVPVYVYPIIVVAGIVISYLVIKKLRNSKSKDNFSKDDIISILDKAKSD
ncbi:MAG: hypothetical protein DA329_12715, partial [Candidatus Nitrosocosmicus sp.]|nr:hypothetical protein [Candidatus Nitrosocosmicus sp.]